MLLFFLLSKSILRNRKFSFKEVLIIFSEFLEDFFFFKFFGEFFLFIEGKFKSVMKDKVKSVFDDYREFFEKLKRKIIGFVSNNLVFLSVMEENIDKVKLNLFNVLSNVENNNFVIEGED